MKEDCPLKYCTHPNCNCSQERNVQIASDMNRKGISNLWLNVFAEFQQWYGDIRKKETDEEFLRRLQTEYESQSVSQPHKRTEWIWAKTESDCPEKDDWRDDPTEYILRVMHDDGRGGNHIMTAKASEIWEIARSNDGAVYWLNEKAESKSVSQPQWIDVKFKTLEWESHDFALTCDIIGVHYEIFDNIGGYFLRINYGETIKGKSIADCKQLAQGDFEAKCKSLLKP